MSLLSRLFWIAQEIKKMVFKGAQRDCPRYNCFAFMLDFSVMVEVKDRSRMEYRKEGAPLGFLSRYFPRAHPSSEWESLLVQS